MKKKQTTDVQIFGMIGAGRMSSGIAPDRRRGVFNELSCNKLRGI
jgi:hypothetical protein